MTTAARLRPLAGTPMELFELLRRWWDAPDGPVVVRTSGSTGEPKDVVLSAAALRASATAADARLGGPGQWLLALPATYVAGLNVLVRSVLAATPPVVPTGSIVQAAADMTGPRRFTALVPTQLHRLAETAELSALRGFDAVLVGGASLRPELAERAVDAGVRLVRTYGASETCGGCVYDGVPLDRVGVRLGTDARVHLAGPVLFDGYDGRPDLTAQVLRDGWFATGDLGSLDDDGRLRVLGRADDVAVTGGVNVPLAAVTAALQALPGVHDGLAVGVPDAEWGELVAAVLVGDTDPAEVRDAVAATLPRAWAPRRVVQVDALPLLDTGKVDRVAVQALAAGA